MKIQTKPVTKEYSEGWDRVFGKKDKLNLYRVTKYYRGGSTDYYVEVSKMTEDLMERIGEGTNGGHNEGYTIRAKRIKKLPDGAKLLEIKTVR